MKSASPARACGIDFGTSNSTVGWLRPGVETLIALEDDKITLPSVVFFNMEERRPVYGRLALHEYLALPRIICKLKNEYVKQIYSGWEHNIIIFIMAKRK